MIEAGLHSPVDEPKPFCTEANKTSVRSPVEIIGRLGQRRPAPIAPGSSHAQVSPKSAGRAILFA